MAWIEPTDTENLLSGIELELVIAAVIDAAWVKVYTANGFPVHLDTQTRTTILRKLKAKRTV